MLEMPLQLWKESGLKRTFWVKFTYPLSHFGHYKNVQNR